MAYFRLDLYSFMLLFALCCPVPGSAQTDEQEDDFRLARNLFRDAGDYATAAALFADFIRNYPASPPVSYTHLTLPTIYSV